ncbi:outer membrane lipoprotein-sorting protein [Sinobacterium caligoides]|uniref:Outer membrane lipoprotein-sorting protein n=1 Tax=Sinobacterium caligoides TaxID=933926 RepID=A0A3N2DPE9_9GAMM|nr:outer membrane lipoprotein carrier protein LolA [Sinobacterium caligoides]ROS01582.1 outer membrane lipoprotein-sorting protein [Sinobacterium caligoides]
MLRLLVLWLALAVLSASVQANDNEAAQPGLAQVSARLASQLPLAGHFQQTRWIAMLSKPLITEGEFYVAQDGRFYWHQQIPFENKLCIRDDNMKEQLGEGEIKTQAAAQNPMMFNILELFSAIMVGDMATLEKSFSPRFETLEKADWRLRLIPKQAPLNAIFTDIVVEGDDQSMRRLALHEVRGDKSIIEFSQLVHSNKLIAEQWPPAVLGWCDE